VGLGGTWGLRGYPRFSYITGSRALMLNTEWRFPLTDYLSFGFPFGEARFPGIQGAVFGDIGAAWSSFSTRRRGALGAYGLGLRMAVVFPLVLRLDVGWRYGSRSGYSLPADYRGTRFVDFWFGYNY
jgi:hemolysin activation/secretion protein